MSIGIIELHHVNITVTRALEQAAKNFYALILGLEEIPKPETSRGRGGAWYQLGPVQLHLSIEEPGDQTASTRHVCLTVENIGQAEDHLRAAGVEILSDPRPIPGTTRFYVRDPSNNLIEIAERKNH